MKAAVWGRIAVLDNTVPQKTDWVAERIVVAAYSRVADILAAMAVYTEAPRHIVAADPAATTAPDTVARMEAARMEAVLVEPVADNKECIALLDNTAVLEEAIFGQF